MDTYTKRTKASVTNVLKCGEEYLFIQRIEGKEDLGGVMTGIGGKLEEHENYVDAAIRETLEETGISVSKKQIRLKGVERWNYKNTEKADWIVNFFLIEVDSKEIPNGDEIEEGSFVWMSKDEVIKKKETLLDDMELVIDFFISEEKQSQLFFVDALVSDDHKIISHSLSVLDQ